MKTYERLSKLFGNNSVIEKNQESRPNALARDVVGAIGEIDTNANITDAINKNIKRHGVKFTENEIETIIRDLGTSGSSDKHVTKTTPRAPSSNTVAWKSPKYPGGVRTMKITSLLTFAGIVILCILLQNCGEGCGCENPYTDEEPPPIITTLVYIRHHNSTENPYKRVYTFTGEGLFTLDTYSYIECDDSGNDCTYDFDNAFATGATTYTMTTSELGNHYTLVDTVDWSAQIDITDTDATGTCNTGDRQFLVTWDDDSLVDFTIDGSVSCDDAIVPAELRAIENEIDALAVNLE